MRTAKGWHDPERRRQAGRHKRSPEDLTDAALVALLAPDSQSLSSATRRSNRRSPTGIAAQWGTPWPQIVAPDAQAWAATGSFPPVGAQSTRITENATFVLGLDLCVIPR